MLLGFDPILLPILIGCACLFLTFFLVRIIHILGQIQWNRRRAFATFHSSNQQCKSTKRKQVPTDTKKIRPLKTCIVLGSGGHTTEMIQLISTLSSQKFSPIHYIVADTDTTSLMRLQHTYNSSVKKQTNENTLLATYSVHRIPRAREVGQSYLSSIFTTCYSFLHSFLLIFYTIRPQVLLCNGPGTCLPITILCFFSRIFNCFRFPFDSSPSAYPTIIFIESFCRVKTLSLTGLVLYKLGICDLFCVHWPDLIQRYDPKKKGDLILLQSFIQHDSVQTDDDGTKK